MESEPSVFKFHPEVTFEMMCDWTGGWSPSATAPGAQDRDTQLSAHTRHDAALGARLDKFIDGWLEGE